LKIKINDRVLFLAYGFPGNGDCDNKALLTWNNGAIKGSSTYNFMWLAFNKKVPIKSVDFFISIKIAFKCCQLLQQCINNSGKINKNQSKRLNQNLPFISPWCR
jgi:hypothetical protein